MSPRFVDRASRPETRSHRPAPRDRSLTIYVSSASQMDPKFLRNQKFAKRGSLKAAGKK